MSDQQQEPVLTEVDPERTETDLESLQNLEEALNVILDGKPRISDELCGEQVGERFNDLNYMGSKVVQLRQLIQQATELKDRTMQRLQINTHLEDRTRLFSVAVVNLNTIINAHHSFIITASIAIKDGKFFSPMDDVFDVEKADFNTADVAVFNRGHSVVTKRWKGEGKLQIDHRYEYTAEGAVLVTSKVIYADQSRSKTPSEAPSIFGVYDVAAHSAHLLPQIRDCAKCSYHFVPWVLKVVLVSLSDINRWTYMQKCIHGFSSEKSNKDNPSTGSKKGNETKTDFNETPTNLLVDVNTDKRVQKKPKGEQHMTESNSDTTTTDANNRRVDMVGIKNFSSNRILLAGQADYFDKHHCVLIIPIMDQGTVTAWKGEGYSAIVLASKFKVTSNLEIPASQVYNDIHASTGPLLFATESDCITACELLKIMILCVSKSFKETFPIDFLYSKNAKKKDDLEKAFSKLNLSKSELDQRVPVPKIKKWTNHMNVRKVKFCALGENIINESPAPDPVLLLGKAASNWLMLQEIPLLPGCSDDSSLDNSNNTVTYSVEAAARGWSPDIYKKPRIDEISFVACETFDESLSDDDNE